MNVVVILGIVTLFATWFWYRMVYVVGPDAPRHAGHIPKQQNYAGLSGRMTRGQGSTNTLEIDF